MGITGLLPALKSIQTTRHLKEYAGQTIAVDAYVWLHKGVYACASDLAMGKATTKYVDYAMHRVRMLRYFGIEPYIVFDGGPLPAKRGTEAERRKKRAEHRAKGKALVAQGKESLARDSFIKCIDVTPQMAFQLIKALKAEQVSYIVAPYEADAQLAYLERIGIVDAILTEDSDLLVFGCKNVLFKLDHTAHTVVSISREDFGSVTTPGSDVSLVGWSDVQFRAMAILSGCDYLPSIPGIGLKTACNLLRKWKTADQVIKAITLEGKKPVPVDYAKNFVKAEKCFLHQRVYCPLEERLVHMTPVDGEWTADFDDYCGIELDARVAKGLAMGDLEPNEFKSMVDINPAFQPGPRKQAPVDKNGKAREIVAKPRPSGGIHNFFGPNPIIPQRVKVAPLPVASAGRASGKRTLVEIAEQEIASRKKHKPRQSTPAMLPTSKFFKAKDTGRRHSLDLSTPGPSRLQDQCFEKENMEPADEWQAFDDQDEQDRSDLSLCAQKEDDSEHSELEEPPVVHQEDGYISPMAPSSPVQQSCEFSSPSRGRDDDIGEPVSSPSSAVKQRKTTYRRPQALSSSQSSNDAGKTYRRPQAFASSQMPVSTRQASVSDDELISTPVTERREQRKTGSLGASEILVHDTPTPASRSYVVHSRASTTTAVVNLTTLFVGRQFGGETVLDGDEDEEDEAQADETGSATPPSPSPDTPKSTTVEALVKPPVIHDVDDLYDELYDTQERANLEAVERQKVVAQGWKDKFAYGTSTSTRRGGGLKGKARLDGGVSKIKKKVSLSPSSYKRSNTNVTPAGWHTLGKQSRLSFPLPSGHSNSRRGVAKGTPLSGKGTVASRQLNKVSLHSRANPIAVDDFSDEDDDEITTLSSPPVPRRKPLATVGGPVHTNGTESLMDRFKRVY